MGYDNENRILQAVKLEQQRRNDLRGLAIEVAGRFVAQQQNRIVDKSSRQGYSLFFAARQLGGAMIEPITEPYLIEERTGAPGGVIPRSRDKRWRQDIFEHRTLGQQAMILEYKADLLVSEDS